MPPPILCLSCSWAICLLLSNACIQRSFRLEAFLKAWSFHTNSKSVLSLMLNGWQESVFCKTGFINSQLVRLQVWMKLEASENSEDISSGTRLSINNDKWWGEHNPHLPIVSDIVQCPCTQSRKTGKVTQTFRFRTYKKALIFMRFEQNEFKILILSFKNHLHIFW